MWVVTIGIVPLIWHYVVYVLKRESFETQYIIGRMFFVSIIALLYYIMIFGTQYLETYEYILGVPISILIGNMHFEIILRWLIHNEKIKNEKGYSAAFKDCDGLIVLRIIILAVVVMFKMGGR